MKKATKKLTSSQKRWRNFGWFVLKTLFYFGILLALVYLYNYSGVGAAHFIYNEF